MKIEFRDVVVKQPVYIADDGTVFDNEDACTDYEFNCLEKTLTYYDRNGKPIDDVMECCFINLVTATDVKAFKHICDICDIPVDGLDEPGLHVYVECGDAGWVNVDDFIFRIRGGVTYDQN